MSLMASLFGRRSSPTMTEDGDVPELLRHGRELAEAGRLEEAEASFLRALQASPDNREALFSLGETLRKRGASEASLACFEQLLTHWPDYIPALRQGAMLLAGKMQWVAAAEWGQKVLSAEPQDDKARRFVAAACRKAGYWQAAEQAILGGLERNPSDDWLYTELGWTLRQLDRYDEAETAFHRASELNPEAINPMLGLVAVFRESGRTEDAAEQLKRLLAVHPDNPNVLMALAEQQKKQGDFEAALNCYRSLAEMEPHWFKPWLNLDPLLFRLGRFDEAMAAGRRAVELDPTSHQAHLNLAIGALTLGLFEEGWRHYQWRFGVLILKDYPAPPLPGNPLVRLPGDLLPMDFAGRRVTLVEDQGLGDELSFLRFAPLLRTRGAHVVYVPDPKIASLVARAGAVDRVTAPGEDAPRDTEVFLAPGDLPLMLGIFRAEQIPPPLPLVPRLERAQAIRGRIHSLGLAGKTLVGLTWRGGTKRPRGGVLYKEVPPAELAKLLRNLPVEVLVLQRNPLPGEIDDLDKALGRPAHNFSDLNSDLEWMLALVDCLDEYVTVSNTNLHLRACTGKSARVLVPFPPDYRWMTEGDESPWFPGIQIYRQQVGGDWSDALARLGSDLQQQFGVAEVPAATQTETAPTAPATAHFSRGNPSPRYRALIDLCRSMHQEGERFLGIPAGETFAGQSLGPQAPRIRRLIQKTRAKTLLDYGSGKGMLHSAGEVRMSDGAAWPSLRAYWDDVSVRCYDPAYPPFSALPEEAFDGVFCTDVLEHCPAEDLQWIVTELFGFAHKFVFANITSYPARKHLPNGENAHVTIRPLAWWQALFEKAAEAHPAVYWEVWVRQACHDASGRKIEEVRLSSDRAGLEQP